MKLFFLILFFALAGCASTSAPIASKPLSQNAAYGAWESAPLEASEGVVLIPQWHLSPQTNTRTSDAPVPQAQNQVAIYKELATWISAKEIQGVVIEGCEGDFDKTRSVAFNGWSLDDLKAVASDPKFEDIQTHVGNKLAAKFGRKVQIECGDSVALLKENLLALSDVRGLAGFKARIERSGLSAKDKDGFVDALKPVLKLPPETPKKDALIALDKALAKSLDTFEEKIRSRNDVFIAKTKSLKGRRVIIIGSLHIADLKSKFESQKIPIAVWRPVGLNDSDANILREFRKFLDQPQAN